MKDNFVFYRKQCLLPNISFSTSLKLGSYLTSSILIRIPWVINIGYLVNYNPRWFLCKNFYNSLAPLLQLDSNYTIIVIYTG